MKTGLLLPSLVVLIMMLAFCGCESANQPDYEEQLVLQGLMYIQRPLYVSISRTVPYEAEYYSSNYVVRGAIVQIVTPTDTIRLYELSDEPGAYEARWHPWEPSPMTLPNVPYSIHVEAEGRNITAATRGAGNVDITYSSANVIEYNDTEFVLRWSKDTLAAGYAIIVENVELDWNLESRRVSGDISPNPSNWFSWVVPNTQDSLSLPWIAFGWTGRHEVRVITCDQALYDYMWTYNPTTVENYPVTNVHGALGIFAVGDADTTYFTLTDTLSDGANN